MVTPERIKAVVCEQFNISPRQFSSKRRFALLVFARQVAMALAYELNGGLLKHWDIARVYRLERSSATYAIRAVRDKCEAYPKHAAEVAAIKEKLMKG